jgi:hypothetical protein
MSDWLKIYTGMCFPWEVSWLSLFVMASGLSSDISWRLCKSLFLFNRCNSGEKTKYFKPKQYYWPHRHIPKYFVVLGFWPASPTTKTDEIAPWWNLPQLEGKTASEHTSYTEHLIVWRYRSDCQAHAFLNRTVTRESQICTGAYRSVLLKNSRKIYLF